MREAALLFTVSKRFLSFLSDALTSLAALDNLTSIGGLVVDNNDARTSLAALDNLTSIGDLVVPDNDALASLAGLDNVDTIDGTLRIHDNSELPQGVVDEWVAGGVTHGGSDDVTSNNNGDNAVCE